ncbi:hypothetical protein [Chamaesiphon polymorphus]|uniref:DUF4384 domain-containing protein n=1 Tax=Chamaesiphon polymorphus CCALA 037 TaxID=2107692 RepID=A0A2T1GFX4_9CYAN|nr:hypothetical protein [Chamaesiphon polymorphus]PSB56462.1 hypothetical protein C7B77_11750 [Chamaesiphon polymorphus CCALA 037]
MDRWLNFLESLATECKLPPAPRKLFLFHFDLDRKQMSVEEIEKNFLAANPTLNSNNFDDYRKRLYFTFEEFCLELQNKQRNKAATLWQWLEDRYADWAKQNIPASLDEIWQQLWQIGEDRSDVFGIVTPRSLQSLGIASTVEEINYPSEFSSTIEVGNSINIKVNPVVSGKIMLLERSQTGNVYCLCPSHLSSENTLSDRSLIIFDNFITIDEPDRVQLLMLTAPKLPQFDWFPTARGESLQIDREQLTDVLVHITLDGKVWRNTYTVIRP